ncbi:MAG: hypothetical protein V2G42_07235 [bacterium JZ-2024 1]
MPEGANRLASATAGGSRRHTALDSELRQRTAVCEKMSTISGFRSWTSGSHPGRLALLQADDRFYAAVCIMAGRCNGTLRIVGEAEGVP